MALVKSRELLELRGWYIFLFDYLKSTGHGTPYVTSGDTKIVIYLYIDTSEPRQTF